MSKVWLVFSGGSPDEWSPELIFSSREAAEQYAESKNAPNQEHKRQVWERYSVGGQVPKEKWQSYLHAVAVNHYTAYDVEEWEVQRNATDKEAYGEVTENR